RGDLRDRRGFELAWSRLRFATTADQPGSLQHREVLAHRWAAHVERPRQLLHVRVSGGQSLQDRPPRRVCECGKRSAQRVRCHLTIRLTNLMVTCKQAQASSPPPTIAPPRARERRRTLPRHAGRAGQKRRRGWPSASPSRPPCPP